jgi:aminomethyltransferase
MKKTILCQDHEKLGAKMVEFAGWYMPIQYKGLREEHNCVRQHVGIFDVSHMGEIRVRGPKSLETLEWLTTNKVANLKSGDAQYGLLPNETGGLVDDLFIYCIKPNEDYLVCVNASNKDKDFAWMKSHNKGADLSDESDKWGQIAVQGPNALDLCDRVFGFPVSEMKRNTHRLAEFKGHKIIVATTGYTGEMGTEVFIENAGTPTLWRALLDQGQDLGIQPIGLGARDTLRTEMKYSLYGNEIDDHSNPYEAGLGWVVKPEKDFIGRTPIIKLKESGLKRKLVGFKMLDKGIPRHGYGIVDAQGTSLGIVTSGTHSPSLDEPVGIGYVEVRHAALGSEIYIDIRGRKVKAQVAPTPFVQKP